MEELFGLTIEVTFSCTLHVKSFGYFLNEICVADDLFATHKFMYSRFESFDEKALLCIQIYLAHVLEEICFYKSTWESTASVVCSALIPFTI